MSTRLVAIHARTHTRTHSHTDDPWWWFYLCLLVLELFVELLLFFGFLPLTTLGLFFMEPFLRLDV